VHSIDEASAKALYLEVRSKKKSTRRENLDNLNQQALKNQLGRRKEVRNTQTTLNRMKVIQQH
jgi:hypothetical protein